MSEPTKTTKTPGHVAYDAYGDNRHWLTVGGTAMPPWEDQKPEIAAAWEAAAEAVIHSHETIRCITLQGQVDALFKANAELIARCDKLLDIAHAATRRSA